jgi:hypothetical protein
MITANNIGQPLKTKIDITAEPTNNNPVTSTSVLLLRINVIKELTPKKAKMATEKKSQNFIHFFYQW